MFRKILFINKHIDRKEVTLYKYTSLFERMKIKKIIIQAYINGNVRTWGIAKNEEELKDFATGKLIKVKNIINFMLLKQI